MPVHDRIIFIIQAVNDSVTEQIVKNGAPKGDSVNILLTKTDFCLELGSALGTELGAGLNRCSAVRAELRCA